MYSTFNEGKSVAAERFIRTLKNKIFKHMTAIYFDVLDIVNKYNNTIHRTIKMKPIDVTDDSFAQYNEDSNERNPKFKIGDHVRISKYKNIFAKGYAPNWSEEIFVIKKVKNTVSWTYVINDLNNEEIVGSFYEKYIFFNWHSLHARLNSHYEAWSYKKKKAQKRLQATENLFRKNLQLKDVC